MSLRKSESRSQTSPTVVSSVAMASLGNALPPIVGLLTAPILAQSLGVAGRGELAAITAPLLLVVNIATLGIPDALTYLTARRGKRIQLIAAIAMLALGIVGIASSAGLFLLAPVLSGGDPELARLIALAGLAVAPSLILAALRGIAMGYEDWTLITMEKLVGSGCRLVAIVGLALADALTLTNSAAVIVITTFCGIVVYAALPWSARRSSVSPGSGEMGLSTLVSYSARVWVGSLTGILLTRLTQTLMVPLSTPTELGLFAVAQTIAEVTLIFNAAVAGVIFARESRSEDAERLASATRISTTITLILSVVVGAMSIWALPVLFGAGFGAALPSLWILLAATVIGNPGSVAGSGLKARGRPGLRSLSLTIALVVNVGAIFWLVPSLGSVGASIALLLGNAIAGLLNLVWLRIFFGLPMSNFLGWRRTDYRFVRRLTTNLTNRKDAP